MTEDQHTKLAGYLVTGTLVIALLAEVAVVIAIVGVIAWLFIG